MSGFSTTPKRFIILLAVFSIAMAFLEAVVVIYLRELYYPEGFAFPLKFLSPEFMAIEYAREIATLVMLFAVAAIAARNFTGKFIALLICFGLWDLFYYLWLKVLLDWPPSLFTWDILFLIPVVWIGPVLAPVLSAITMLLLAGLLIYFQDQNGTANLILREWALLLSGAFLVFCTFIWDSSRIILEGKFFSTLWNFGIHPEFLDQATQFVPTQFHWGVFSLGELLMLAAMGLLIRRVARSA